MSTRPFNQGFVLRATARHMRRCIDISIRKTFERVAEFADDPAKSREVFQTLSNLHTMRKQLDDFQEQNAAEFKA